MDPAACLLISVLPAHALTVPEAIWEHPSGKSDVSEIMLRALAEMPASTVRSLMLVLRAKWPRDDSQLAPGESANIWASWQWNSQDAASGLPRA